MEDAAAGLDVVVEHLGPCGHYLFQGNLRAAEIGRQHLYLAAGDPPMDLLNTLGKDESAPISEVVAVHRRNDTVAQAEARHCLR